MHRSAFAVSLSRERSLIALFSKGRFVALWRVWFDRSLQVRVSSID
jgi:hypothetical protein